jgi:hypothetical protein
VHDYILHEMAKIRIEELREDAARARLAGRTRKPGVWHLGFVGGWLGRRVAGAGLSREAVEEVCCA